MTPWEQRKLAIVHDTALALSDGEWDALRWHFEQERAGALAPLQALIPVFEAKYGIQSSAVALLRDALTRVSPPGVPAGGEGK